MGKNFSDLLKHIIKFTHIKLSSLADFVGYDVSYLSKWCNNINSPSAKYILRINRCIAQFTAHALLKQDLIYPFFNEFNIKSINGINANDREKYLINEINDLLNKAYYHDQYLKTQAADLYANAGSIQHTIVGRENVENFLNIKIPSILNTIKDNVKILITSDIITFLERSDLYDMFRHCHFTSKHIDIYLGCDLHKLNTADNLIINQLYTLLNRYIQIDFHIYSNKNFSQTNLITVKDLFSLQCSLNHDNHIDICTYIFDHKINQQIWQQTLEKFTGEDCLLEPKKDIELIEFRSIFYLNPKLLFFCAKGFEFFLPPQSLQNILHVSRQYHYSHSIEQNISTIQAIWEEQFSSARITFILPEANIIHYLQTGELNYGEIDYTSSGAERQLQLRNLLQCMQHNSAIHLYLISQANQQDKETYYKLSYYSNKTAAYLKKDKNFLFPGSKTIYLLHGKLLINKFDGLFRSFSQNAYCLDSNKINAIYQKNHSLFERIWHKKAPIH